MGYERIGGNEIADELARHGATTSFNPQAFRGLPRSAYGEIFRGFRTRIQFLVKERLRGILIIRVKVISLEKPEIKMVSSI